jgi:dihydrofolate reductase
MRSLVYHVASSLDGFIAGPKGEFDWITHDPTFDFAAIFARFDTLLMGRKTFEVAQSQGQALRAMRKKIVVVSSTLRPNQHPDVRVIGTAVAGNVRGMKEERGGDIWLFGGSMLFRTLLDAGLVDQVEVALIPILLGDGIPLLTRGSRCGLRLKECRSLASGIVQLDYLVGV